MGIQPDLVVTSAGRATRLGEGQLFPEAATRAARTLAIEAPGANPAPRQPTTVGGTIGALLGDGKDTIKKALSDDHRVFMEKYRQTGSQ